MCTHAFIILHICTCTTENIEHASPHYVAIEMNLQKGDCTLLNLFVVLSHGNRGKFFLLGNVLRKRSFQTLNWLLVGRSKIPPETKPGVSFHG